MPSKLHIGAAHPDPVVETASLAAVEPPDITYQLHLEDLIQAKLLSGLQLESIVYACQRHDQLLPDGTRAGMFIGDGAGVGKGRTIAGASVLPSCTWTCHDGWSNLCCILQDVLVVFTGHVMVSYGVFVGTLPGWTAFMLLAMIGGRLLAGSL